MAYVDNTQKPIRVLQIAGGFNKGVSGGVAAFLYNYYKEIDKSRITFDFLAIGYQCFDLYREDLEKMGGTLHCLDVHDYHGFKGKAAYVKKLSQFLESHSYDIIHVNMGAFYPVLLCSLVAKWKGKGAKVIAHCHNELTYRGIRRFCIELSKPLFKYVADYFCACSFPAGKYMFPKKIVNSDQFSIIKNAIDSDRFIYNEKIRAEYRNLLKVHDEVLIGHVGRFNKQKNHAFIIDTFNSLHKKHPKSKLVLVGTGALEEEIRAKVHSLNLDESVIFAGQRRDVNKLMQAMDVFLFPSLFEGLGIAAIEAQAAGLPVITSDAIPVEAKVSDLFWQLPLDADPERWADTILNLCRKHQRRDTQADIIAAGYDIKNSVKGLEKIYINLTSG